MLGLCRAQAGPESWGSLSLFVPNLITKPRIVRRPLPGSAMYTPLFQGWEALVRAPGAGTLRCPSFLGLS